MSSAQGVEAKAKSGDVVALTQLLVRAPSVNPVLEAGGAGEHEVATLCSDWLSHWGYDTQLYEAAPGRWNVVGRLGTGGPVTLLNGHLDTVGVDGMTIDPFTAEVRDGRLWGRGSADMKGGDAAILSAAYHYSVASDRVGTLIVALTADEEHASAGMQAFIAQLTSESTVVDRAIVCEPTSLAVMPAHKGFLWLTAHFAGVAAHGSRPDVGVDAVRYAGMFIAELEALHRELGDRPQHPLLGAPSFHFGRVRGGVAPSVYPDACTVEIERRTLPQEGPTVEEEFRAVLETTASRHDAQVSMTTDLYRPGSDVPVDAPVVTALLSAIEAEGHSRSVAGMTAWVDAAYLNDVGIPAVCFGPGSIEQAHTSNESVAVSELEAAARVLSRFLLT